MATPPASIGRYQVVRPIGQGGMGALYLAFDPKLDRQLAIKLLKDDDDELRERFSREARAAARLRHPHIVTIFDVGEHDGHPFIAMEFVQGETLADVIRHRHALPLVRKIELIEELCDGLGFAHKAGIVHRDVKPANIMVDSEGSLKILDFGIARAAETAGMTQAGMLIGTLNYMSPEQVSGQVVDLRSDLFAVGTVFYELLSFHQAFPGNILGGILNKILHDAPEPLDDIVRGLNPDVIRIVNRAIEKDPGKRYPDLVVMRKELFSLRMKLESGESPTQVIDTPTIGMPQPGDLRSTPSKPTPAPNRRTADLEELGRRRAGQIQAQIDAAEAAMASGDFEAAITACEHVLMLDTDEPRALEMLDRARTALEQRQAKVWLESAEDELSRGALTSARGLVDRAAALDPAAPRADELKHSVDEAFAEREKQRRRQEAIRAALERGQARLTAGEFEAAEQAADEALAIDAAHAAALTLRTHASEGRIRVAREALERRAQEAVAEAKKLFGRSEHQAAIDLLGKFEPKHEHVTRTLAEMLAEAARRAERAAAISREMSAAVELRSKGDLRAALTRVEAALAVDGAHTTARELKAALERDLHAKIEREQAEARAKAEREQAEARAKAEREQAEARARAEEARAKIEREQAEARAKAEEARAKAEREQAEARARHEREQAEARARHERQEQIAAAMKRARKAKSHEIAIVALREALQVDPDHADARKMLIEHQEGLAREQAQAREQALARERERVRRDEEAAARAAAAARPEPLAHDAETMSGTVVRPAPRPSPSEEQTIPLPRPAATKTSAPAHAAAAPVGPSERTDKVPIPSAGSAATAMVAQNRRVYIGIAAVAALVLIFVGYKIFGGPASTGTDTTSPSTGNIASNAASTSTPVVTPQPSAPQPSTPIAPPPVPVSPAPTATTTTTARGGVTPSTTPVATPNVAARLDAIWTDAKAKYDSGDRTGALASALDGLKLDKQDRRLLSIVTQVIKDAQGDVTKARDAADRVGSAATSSPKYQDAKDALQRADQASSQRNAAPDDVFRQYRGAASLFDQAAEEGRRAEPVRTPVSPPRPTNTPVVSSPSPTTPPLPTTSPGVPVGSAAGAAPGSTALPPPPPPPSNADIQASIRSVLGQFIKAYNDKDAAAVVKVYPQDAVALKKLYDDNKLQKMTVSNDQISLAGNKATLTCVVKLDVQGPVGSAKHPILSASVFQFQKIGDRWVIASMTLK